MPKPEDTPSEDDSLSGFTVEDYLESLEQREEEDASIDSEELKIWPDEPKKTERDGGPPNDRQPTWGELRRQNERLKETNQQLREEKRELARKAEPEKYEQAVQIVRFVKSNEMEARKRIGKEELFKWVGDNIAPKPSEGPSKSTVRGRLHLVGLLAIDRQGRQGNRDTLRRILDSDL